MRVETLLEKNLVTLMEHETSYLMVFSTVPNESTAEYLAKALLENKLAACINIIRQLTSVYIWEGQLVTDTECLLLIKTLQENYTELAACLRQIHPYSLPEIIALPITQGNQDYLDWLKNTVKKP